MRRRMWRFRACVSRSDLFFDQSKESLFSRSRGKGSFCGFVEGDVLFSSTSLKPCALSVPLFCFHHCKKGRKASVGCLFF